jgi:hypothetical protein
MVYNIKICGTVFLVSIGMGLNSLYIWGCLLTDQLASKHKKLASQI